MTIIETGISHSPNNIHLLFGYLSDMCNYKQLIPEDKIENWQAENDSCSFRIKGMTDIGLRVKDLEVPNKVSIESTEKAPFSFEFDILLKEQSENQTSVQIVFQGEINAFMKVMVEKPLRNFFELIVEKASEINL